MARQLRRATAGNAAVAPPARKAPAKPAARPVLRPSITRQGRGITQFLTEVRSELRKVVWPTRREATNLTVLVVGLSLAVGFLLGLIDYAFSEFFRLLVG
ncbi:MAG TPA: preprotein translocase subunit SecE [Chloroflexota bacterium]|nr:preprotein translocase subunit SecE [Chloroflexota bacterium]